MKNKEVFKLIFNPFNKVAGWEALGLGLVIACATTILGKYSHAITDGAIDFHLVQQTGFYQTALFTSISLISIIVCMALAALIISKNFRFIDIAGTMSLAKAPLILAVILGFFTTIPDKKAIIENLMIVLTSLSFIVISLIIIPITIWSIALMFNAFKVSTGSKGAKLIVSFVIALLAAEVLSKVIISMLITA